MSPTYWTASQIKAAARTHDWHIAPNPPPEGVWACRRGRCKVQIKERRDGGLSWVSFTFPVSDGSNCDYLGPRYRNKFEEVIKFLEDPTCRHPWAKRPA